MAVKKEVYRLTFTSDEIFSLISVLMEARNSVGLEIHARTALDKIDDWAYKINKGTANAAYVQSGTKKVGISLESLGGTSEDEKNFVHSVGTARTSVSTTVPTKPSSSGELTPEQEDELERENAAMLAEFAASGNENVVLEERRKVSRTLDTSSNDSALFSSL